MSFPDGYLHRVTNTMILGSAVEKLYELNTIGLLFLGLFMEKCEVLYKASSTRHYLRNECVFPWKKMVAQAMHVERRIVFFFFFR